MDPVPRARHQHVHLHQANRKVQDELKKGRAKTESKGQKKAKHEEEKQGIMRDIDDREQLAKKLEEGVERKPQERRSPGSGMGVNMVDMIDMIKSSRGIK